MSGSGGGPVRGAGRVSGNASGRVLSAAMIVCRGTVAIGERGRGDGHTRDRRALIRVGNGTGAGLAGGEEILAARTQCQLRLAAQLMIS